jgi:uncharacterized protein DUF4338
VRTACGSAPLINGSRKKRLRSELRKHLVKLGYTKNCKGYFLKGKLTKKRIRRLYRTHREERALATREFVLERRDLVRSSFADGSKLNPTHIEPELCLVESGTEEADLYRLATLLWSVPVSQGFGRRLRFLVRDRHNGCIMGVFGLTDPVFNLAARDAWIGWDHRDRAKRLVHVMDAFVVGAVPPYSHLIGGKLIAALMASKEVVNIHARKYRGTPSIISEEIKPAKLVLLTTTSALGRSSLYNRLRIPEGPCFTPIGYTNGYGHFHVSERLFERLRALLASNGHPYARGHRFGMGPNWRLRVVRAALDDLGLDADAFLKHGLNREVYGIPLASNFRQILLGNHRRVRRTTLQADDIASYCMERWLLPRATWDNRYRSVTPEGVFRALLRK